MFVHYSNKTSLIPNCQHRVSKTFLNEVYTYTWCRLFKNSPEEFTLQGAYPST